MSMSLRMTDSFKKKIRTIKDFPEPGILFRDITPALTDYKLCQEIVSHISGKLRNQKIGYIAAIESRGFFFGLSLAIELKAGLIPIRKKGKLPFEKESLVYKLEYGSSEIEIHSDVLKDGDVVHIHDDLLATGGTADAAAQLISKQGALVNSFSFLIELSALRGKDKLSVHSQFIETLVSF